MATPKVKTIYNQGTEEGYRDAKMIGGNPNGIINFNQTPHNPAYELYKKACNRLWFPSEHNTSKDKQNYSKLTTEEKRAFDLVLAQLITNDSIQTNQLMDGINKYITSPVVNAALCVQAFQETIHAESYSVMAEDIAQDTERIFNLHKHDRELYLKNEAIGNMYASLYDTEEHNHAPSLNEILMVFVANQILEELVFPGGFAVIYTLEKKLPGCSTLIKDIHQDEVGIHVPLFSYIFNTTVKENLNKQVPQEVIEKAHRLIDGLVDREIIWLNYVTKGLLGFSPKSIEIFVKAKGNSICKHLRLPALYPDLDSSVNPIEDILKERFKGGDIESRSNFFETTSTEYTRNNIVVDY